NVARSGRGSPSLKAAKEGGEDKKSSDRTAKEMYLLGGDIGGKLSGLMSGGCRRDARFDARLFTHKVESLFMAEDEGGGGENSGEEAIGGDDGNGLGGVADGGAGAGIEDMAIAAAIDDERSE